MPVIGSSFFKGWGRVRRAPQSLWPRTRPRRPAATSTGNRFSQPILYPQRNTPTPAPQPEIPAGKTITPVSVGVAKIGAPIPAGGSVTAEQICIGPASNPCAVVYLLSAGEYVTRFPGTKASIAKRKGVVLGRAALTLHGGQRRKVSVKLNAAGTKLLKRKGRLVVYFTATQAGGNGTPPRLLKRMKITLRAHR